MGEDYFLDSVPGGIANAIDELFPEAECTGQDGYELLLSTFGKEVNGDVFKAFTSKHCSKMAHEIQRYFELPNSVSEEKARYVIERALKQWNSPQ